MFNFLKIVPLLFAYLLVLQTSLTARQIPGVKTETYRLQNGLTVMLNPDPESNRVFGAVAVNVGAKQESPDATGMAHYLEHLLFKGTSTLGTVDFEKEKPYLDSISLYYDRLGEATTETERAEIQQKINRQAIKAAEYGLPNEFDKLLKEIGSTGVNAYTNYDMTFYHNSFPAHEINKWLHIYAERFSDPVFRSFQSELEVVYEEKNRAQDNLERRVAEKIGKTMFKGLPYGEWSVLGKKEHLKNPSLNKMYDFFKQYYVANNMALILTGNFKVAEVKPLIAAYFGKLKSGEVSQFSLENYRGFRGEEKENMRILPVKAGFLNFHTPGRAHPDRPVADVYEFLISNSYGTGLADKMLRNNGMMYGTAITSRFNDLSGYTFLYLPRILIQSLNNAEQKVNGILDSLNNGNFDASLLEIARKKLQTDFYKSLEEPRSRASMMGRAFTQGKSWEEYLEYPRQIASVSKEDIQRIGRQYYGADRQKIINRMGFSKKEKLQKPAYKPVVTKQSGVSEYAAVFRSLPAATLEPEFIDFKNDIMVTEPVSGHTIIGTENRRDKRFVLKFSYLRGYVEDQRLLTLSSVLNSAGAGAYSAGQLKRKFADLGVSYRVETSPDRLTFRLEGEEKNLEQAFKLLQLLLTDPKMEQADKKAYLNKLLASRRRQKNSINYLSEALYYYGLFGENSIHLQRQPVSDQKKLEFSAYRELLREITGTYGTETEYYGSKTNREIAAILGKYTNMQPGTKADTYRLPELKNYKKDKVFLVNDKKAVQNRIYYIFPDSSYTKEDYTVMNAYNQYIGGGFSGLVLQEIREYRSLAYTARAGYVVPPVPEQNGWLSVYMGTQADKSTEAIKVMNELLGNLPLYPERMKNVQQASMLKAATAYPQKKQLAGTILRMKRKGHENDPNRRAFTSYADVTMQDLENFHRQITQSKRRVILIYGNLKNLDMNMIRQLGDVTVLKKKDIARF